MSSLFGDKKTISVSSTLYNMAGPEGDRPNYLKGTVFGSVMNDVPYLGESIQDSYFNGPGLGQRLFYKYAVREDYDGFPNVSITNQVSIDPDVIEPFIPLNGAESISVQRAYLDDGDAEIFMERWILENHTNRVDENWTGDYDPSTGDFVVIFPNADEFTFVDSDFDHTKNYVVAHYYEIVGEDSGTMNVVSTTNDVLEADLPDTSAYTRISGSGLTGVWQKEETVSATGFTQKGIRKQYEVIEQDPADWADPLIEEYDVIYSEQNIYDQQTTGEKMFIYEIGDGNATLDALESLQDTTEFQEFYPILPLRLNNRPISHPDFKKDGPTPVSDFPDHPDNNDLYDQTKKMYRRGFNFKSMDRLLDDLDENENIDDIDFAYILWGSSLNTQEQASRRYMYQFWKKLMDFQLTDSNTISDFQAQVDAYEAAKVAYADWEADQNSGEDWDARTPPPTIPKITLPPTSKLNLEPVSAFTTQYPNLNLKWVHIVEEQINGTFTFTEEDGVTTRTSKYDECELRVGPPGFEYTEEVGILWGNTDSEDVQNTTRVIDRSIPSMEIYYQIDRERASVPGSQDIYRKITVYGAVHQNRVYGGKSVTITSTDALEDDDPSGFLIPLHEPTFKAMGMVDYTQMATANCHILVNAYTVVTQKWYERTAFKILLVLVVLVVAVIIAPGAFAGGGGILGGNAALGAAAGLTGTGAIVAGVVANYIAGIIVSIALQTISTGLFGEKWGAVFMAIASFGFGLMMSGTSLFSAEGMLGLTNAVSNGYQGFVRGDMMEMQEEMEGRYEDFQKEYKRVDKLMNSLTGGNDLNFDPITLTNSTYGTGNRGRDSGYMPETADEFVSRTTMSGSDIVDATHAMVYRYTDISKTLPRN